MALTIKTIEAVLKHVSFPKTVFHVRSDLVSPYLQIEMLGFCNVTGKPMNWRGRKWKLSYHMTKSEIVQTAFLAVMTAIEHETREQFRYREQPIFGPHYDVEKLVTLAGRPDAEDVRADAVRLR